MPIAVTGSYNVDAPDECIQPGEVMEVEEKLDITTKVPGSGPSSGG